VHLVKRVIEIAASTTSIILDSFAGSGTTGEAVIRQNEEDDGSRTFVLVEMEKYANELTAERIRRVINGYNFTGTQRTELLREQLNWRILSNAAALTDKVEGIERDHAEAFDRIKKEVKGAELIVAGEKQVAERAEGLGGNFTYCTLGAPVELDELLTGEELPSFEAIGAVLFHMATGSAFEPIHMDESRGYLGSSNDRHVWLLYKPDADWLRSTAGALTLSKAQEIQQSAADKPHLVFATARHVSQKLLAEQGLSVEFAPLPFALYRVERG